MRGKEFSELQTFLSVARHLSFIRAAEELNVSASQLSQTIRHLEERLKSRLINRTTRSVSLTEAGLKLYSDLMPAMQSIEEAVHQIENEGRELKGALKLKIPRIAYQTFLESKIGSFCKKYPDIILDITIDDSVSDIVKEGFDLGVRLGELLEEDMVAVKLGPDLRQIAFASPQYLKLHGKPLHPSDLKDHNCINWRQPGTNSLYHWEFSKGKRQLSVAVKGPLIVNDRSIAVTAALQGIGIGYWADHRIRAYFNSGKLVPLLEDWSPSFPGFYLYYPIQRQMGAPLRAFIDFIKSACP